MTRVQPYVRCPVEHRSPDVELYDPQPVEARRAVEALARRTTLSDLGRDSLLGAVSEVVTNARDHGRGRVCLEAWASPHGVVVTVTDGGAGPDHPDAGGRPLDRDPGQGGIGLWLARQLCDELVFGVVPGGFRVRLRSGSVG
jgi:anti-sigma regulatory factor (Ser/Thr protein kinase)